MKTKSKQRVTACYVYEPKIKTGERGQEDLSPREVLKLFAEIYHFKPRFFVDGDDPERKELKKLFRKVRRRRIETIIVADLRQILRSGDSLLELVTFLHDHGTTLISLKESIDSMTTVAQFNLLFEFDPSEEREEKHVIPCLKNRMGNNKDLFPPPPGWNLN